MFLKKIKQLHQLLPLMKSTFLERRDFILKGTPRVEILLEKYPVLSSAVGVSKNMYKACGYYIF